MSSSMDGSLDTTSQKSFGDRRQLLSEMSKLSWFFFDLISFSHKSECLLWIALLMQYALINDEMNFKFLFDLINYPPINIFSFISYLYLLLIFGFDNWPFPQIKFPFPQVYSTCVYTHMKWHTTLIFFANIEYVWIIK